MVGVSFKKIIVGSALTMIFIVSAKAQGNLSDDFYKNWGLVLGPVIYDKPTIVKEYGPFEFNNKRMIGYNVGVEKNILTNKKWTVSLGIIIALEPGYRFETFVKKEDTFPRFEDDLESVSAYAVTSFSAPILIHYDLLKRKRANIDLFTGIKAMYFPSGNMEMTYSVSDGLSGPKKEIFGLSLDSPDNYIQGSIVLGSGLRFPQKNRKIWTVNFFRVINFQNILKGPYWTKNLNVTPLSKGEYKLSGNYWGLVFKLNLNKKEKN